MLVDDAGKACVPAAKQQTSVPINALGNTLQQKPRKLCLFVGALSVATKAAQIHSWIAILRNIHSMASIALTCIGFRTVSTALNRLPLVIFGIIWLPSDASPVAPMRQLANGDR
jgi:hypothetical protein